MNRFDLSPEEFHALFDKTVLVCPNEDCKHEYDDDEVEALLALDADDMIQCPECFGDEAPEPTEVNRLDQFAAIQVEMAETISFLRERVPALAPRLDAAEAEATAAVERILGVI